jgi:hypothetical protein
MDMGKRGFPVSGLIFAVCETMLFLISHFPVFGVEVKGRAGLTPRYLGRGTWDSGDLG